MKKSYSQCWNHERTRTFHTSTNSSATRRRQGAYDRLKKELSFGKKMLRHGVRIGELTDVDIKRINLEMVTLEERL